MTQTLEGLSTDLTSAFDKDRLSVLVEPAAEAMGTAAVASEITIPDITIKPAGAAGIF